MLAGAASKVFLEGIGVGIGIPRPSRRLGRLCCGRRGKWRVSSSADRQYRRIPMETPGAYQLLDETTGEKVIVWGGADDDPHSSPIPDDHVLSWKPRKEKESEVFDATGVGAAVPAAEAGSVPTSQVGRAPGSFGKLKYQKVRALIEKSSQISRENSRFSGVGDPTFNETDDLGSSEGSELSRAKARSRNDDLIEKEVLGTNSLRNASKDEQAADVDVSVSAPRITRSSPRGWGAAAVAVQNSTSARLKQPRRSADGDFFSSKSFKDLGCSDDMIESLRSQTFIRPSHIQALAYGPVLEGRTCIIADQSGSGKTLAYLAPVIQRLREEEVLGIGRSSSRSPRVIILVPTAELASQVLISCRGIAKFGVPFRSMVTTGGFRQKTQLDNLKEGLDVLIATPGRFVYLLREGFVQLTNLKCVVLDEVDILFGDDGFEQVLQSLISSAPMLVQYLFVTATLPVDTYNKLVEIFPDCKVTMGPGMHRTSSRLEEVLVDCSGDEGEEKSPETAFLNKKTALLQLVEESPVPKTIIFCNKIETCRKVENVLKRFDRKQSHIKVLPFHAALDQEIRHSNMKEFLNSQSEYSMILICTDRASRGIDFTKVDHVVLFDFPRDPSEYVRRVGRTARGAGGGGKAYVFVVGKQVSLARRIIERNRKGHPLHDVPCAYELERSVV